jgi:hypothetical protein
MIGGFTGQIFGRRARPRPKHRVEVRPPYTARVSRLHKLYAFARAPADRPHSTRRHRDSRTIASRTGPARA